ncbi:MAG: hypothetical protein MJ016_07515, partial [Victivallaceae bacterium]|nr:hypothetical protein [Victivallaceae bacterium]
FFYFRALALPGSAISILSMLRRCNVVVPFLFGCFFWKEADRGKKSAALLLILAGAAILALAKR